MIEFKASDPLFWERLLRPTAEGAQVPATSLSFVQSEAVKGADDVCDLSQVADLSTEEDVNALVDGYARGIMAVMGQTRIGFKVLSYVDALAAECSVVVAELADSSDLQWNAFAPVKDSKDIPEAQFGLCLVQGKMPVELEGFIGLTLCVDIQSSAAKIIYNPDGREINTLHITQELESYLPRREKDSTEFWTTELKEFIGISERQFPTLSCVRIVNEPDYPPTLSHTLPLGISWAELERFAVRLGLRSAGTIVRAAFAYILSEYFELDRVLLGDVLALSNATAPLPVVIPPQGKVEDLLRRIDDFVTRSKTRAIPSEDSVREILQGPPAQSPFNALFTYNAHPDKTEANSPSNPESTPISFTLQHSDQNTLSCTLSIKGDLIDTAHLELVLQQTTALAITMVANPTSQIQDLTRLFPESLLSKFVPEVSAQLQNAPNLTPFHWVDHHAKTNPTWPALEVISSISDEEIKSQKWTYAELAETSNRISTLLVRKGWRNSTIGVCLGRSFMAYAIVLAIWKSGNCYIPIAEDLPEARRVLLLSDSGATALFSDSEVLGDVVPPEGCEVIDINSAELYKELEAIDIMEPVDAQPEDDCYLLYTSGSTGLPKGVVVTRGNLSAFTEAQSEYICRDVPDTLILGGSGSYLAHASRAFDVHLCEMVLGWRHGLRLVTAPRTMLLDNLRLVLTQCRISHAGFVPSLLEHTGVSAEQLPDLRYLGVGGEKISETIIERFVGKPSIALVNAYGPTEVTIGLTSHTVTYSSTVRNIGSAVGNITLHVLEPESNEYVKRGQAGELCVTGDLVAKGYHGRPDAKGFTDFHGEHMYRTGDIVRLMANNCVEYLGRRDSQAKVRGQRLELEEVSIAVRRCAERPVNVTSIVTPSPITKRPQLVTFISPASDRPENVAAQPQFVQEEYQKWVPQVLERCRQQLPAYMVPSVLLPVSFIPVQISGKADNRRLAALYESIPAADLLHETNGVDAASEEAEDTTPLTAEEQQVCDIVCGITSTDPQTVSKTTSIFKLGIDSLTSLSLATQMRKHGYVCSAGDILRHNTITQLANLPRREGSRSQGNLSEEQTSQAMQQLEDLDQSIRRLEKRIPNSSIAIVRPCLPLQESLVSSSVDNLTPLYVNHIMFRLGATTSLEALKQAFEDLIQENEIFRTCFHVMDDRVVQVVLKPRVVKIAWDEIEVSDEQAAQLHFTNSQADVARKIVGSIESHPPLHITTASSQTTPGWLMLSIHHSIFDGASIGILLDRLYNHYTGETHMQTIDLTPLYRHFVTSSDKEAEAHWSRYLASCHPGIIITETQETPYSIITETLPLSLSSLSSLASNISSTTPLLLETIWAIALAKLLNQGDVLFGRVMNGRAIPVDSVENMLIPLVTTVPARLRLSSASRLVQLIKLHTQGSMDSLPFQHTPLRAIQRYAQAPGALFNSMFSYIGMGPSSAERLLQEMDSVMEVDYPLALEVRANSETDAVTLRLRTAGDPVLTQKANTLISTMLVLLQSLVSTGDAVINEPELGSGKTPAQTNWDESQWADGETEIRRVVGEIAGLEESQITKNISFFALGIDSVISIRLARVLQERGLKATSSDILRYPSVGALYHHLQRGAVVASVDKVEESVVDLGAEVGLFHEDDSIVEVYRCTALQTAMIGQCLSSEGKDYVHHHIVTLDESVDLGRLESAWKQLVEQADILRTSFHRPESGHEFLAAVHRYPLVQWIHREVSLSQGVQAIEDEGRYPTVEDFQRPPWRVTILQDGSQRLMAVTMHHSLYDGFSLPLLFDSLEKLYQDTEIAIGSFSSAARTIANIQDKSAQFWVDTVTGYEHSGLPEPANPETKSHAQWAEVKVQTPVADLLRQCSSLEVTLQTVALLAYGRSLALLLGQRDVVFGHVVSGRSLDIGGEEPMIGPLLNTVPFRLTLDPILQSTRSVLQYIQGFSADALHYQHASLGQVQNAWRLGSKGTSPALFDALFSFNKSEKADTTSLFQPYVADREVASPHYRLNVEFEQDPELLIIRVSCRDVLDKTGELDAWLQTLASSIVDIVDSPDALVLSFPAELGALPLADFQQAEVGEDAESSVLGPQVAVIKDILARVTGTPVEEIQESSNIFTLGVDSILAIDISAKCRDAQLKLSASDIIQGKTVQGIARIAANRPTASEPTKSAPTESIIDSEIKAKALTALALAEDDVEAVLPCLSGQLFYISRWLESGRRIWEFTFAFNSSVRLDEGQLQTAWTQLQQRHSVLRTSFAAVSPNDVVQVVSKPSKANAQVHITKQDSEDLQPLVQSQLKQISSSPSTLSTPPARLHLLQTSTSSALLLTLHHALYDAWSLPILLNDLQALYLNTTLPLPTSFTPFIHQSTRDPTPYWTQALSNSQPTILGSTTTAQDYSNIKSAQTMSPRKLRETESLCREKGISMPTLILLALSRGLARLTNTENPTFGLFQAGRANTFPDIQSMAGPSVNMLPFVVRDALSDVSACAQGIQQDLAERTLHDQTDFRRLLKNMKSSGCELQFNVLVNIVWGKLRDDTTGEKGDSIFTPFAIEGSDLGEARGGETSIDALDYGELPCKSNVMLEVGYSEVEDALVWKMDYTGDLMGEEEAEGILGVIGGEMEGVIAGFS